MDIVTVKQKDNANFISFSRIVLLESDLYGHDHHRIITQIFNFLKRGDVAL